MRLIAELEEIYYLNDLAAEYEAANGAPPFDLSHWDPSEKTINALLAHLKLPPIPLATPYIYSYFLSTQEAVLQRIGFSDSTRTCLFVAAGTTAILAAVWWLKALKLKRLVLLGPAYFPVYYAASLIGLESVDLHMTRTSGGWFLPQDQITAVMKHALDQTALWVTNPVFCTGCYLSNDDINFLASVLEEGGTLVADECLATSAQKLDRTLAFSDRFLSLHSPHKTVCLNAVKFAAIVFDRKYQRFFEDWSDVLSGGLPASSHSAIAHFLGENFFDYQHAFFQHIEVTRQKIFEIITKYKCVECDANSIGHFMTCYARDIPGENGNNRSFLRNFVLETGALVIPGTRNHFSTNIPFNFRINLGRSSAQFFATLHRVLKFLAQ